jgi:hypothetical protein
MAATRAGVVRGPQVPGCRHRDAGGCLRHVRTSVHGETWQCDGPSRHGRLHKRGHYGPDRLVMELNAMELLAFAPTSSTPGATSLTPFSPSWSAHGALKFGSTEEKPEPFARTQRLADHAIARADSAENLKKAIEALRGILTAEQLNKVTELEAKFRSHHKGRFGSWTCPARPGRVRLRPSRRTVAIFVLVETRLISNTLTSFKRRRPLT